MLTKLKSWHYEQTSITYIQEQLVVGSTATERVEEINLLGLKVDEHLSCNAHTNTVANKTAKHPEFLNRLNIFYYMLYVTS